MTNLIAGLYKSLESPPKRPKEYTISGCRVRAGNWGKMSAFWGTQPRTVGLKGKAAPSDRKKAPPETSATDPGPVLGLPVTCQEPPGFPGWVPAMATTGPLTNCQCCHHSGPWRVKGSRISTTSLKPPPVTMVPRPTHTPHIHLK